MDINVIKTQGFYITTLPKVKWAKKYLLLVPNIKNQTNIFTLVLKFIFKELEDFSLMPDQQLFGTAVGQKGLTSEAQSPLGIPEAFL